APFVLRMTTPSKGWTRSFSPSFTFQCTRTVSPVRKSARSFRSCFDSTYSRALRRMAADSDCSLGNGLPGATGTPTPGEPAYLAGRDRARQALGGSKKRLLPAPPSQLFFTQRQEAPVLGTQRHPAQEVRPPFPSPPERLPTAPACHPGVVSALQDGWDFDPTKDSRPGVLGIFQEAVLEALRDGGAGIAEDAGEKPRQRVDDGQRDQLPAGEDEVP